MDFFTGGSTGILCTGSLAGSNGLKIKRLNDGLVCYKLATFHFKRCKLMDWSCVDYFWIIVMFLSAVWTLILTAPIHFNGSIAEQVIQDLHLRWPEAEYIFIIFSFLDQLFLQALIFIYI